MKAPTVTTDLCLKCNLCTSACPVAAVTDQFPGPKAVGPQAQRYRHPSFPSPDRSVDWCSGCGTCTRVCPHGVAVAEINIQAKARAAFKHGIPFRDRLISRPELIGQLASPVASIVNTTLALKTTRILLEKTIGISRKASFPTITDRSLRKRLKDRIPSQAPVIGTNTDRMVAFFYGCSNNYYEPELGELAISVLENFDQQVLLPRQVCCGLPLQSNGLFNAARRYARANISWLAPYAARGIPIVATSTSCSLALKHDYQAVLGLSNDEAEIVASSTYDIFEFLSIQLADRLTASELQSLEGITLYHPPCQLRSHGIGAPAIRILSRIPGLRIHLSDAECCGVAGTYGMKQEKYAVAKEVGKHLFDQARQLKVDFILCDSETCRWWISDHTQIPVYHPLEILARALQIE